ncbi:MAG: ORF6N domain-containing protein [Ignavibacteria bacterium]
MIKKISNNGVIPLERIEHKINLIRNLKVMLDNDLAHLYGVPVKQINQQVKRNIDRFPSDFMFQLSAGEYESLRSQIVTLKKVGTHYKTSSLRAGELKCLLRIIKLFAFKKDNRMNKS